MKSCGKGKRKRDFSCSPATTTWPILQYSDKSYSSCPLRDHSLKKCASSSSKTMSLVSARIPRLNRMKDLEATMLTST